MTHVVLRMVYRDDPFQADRASLAWQAAVASGGIFLTMVVLVELAWVLRVAAKFDRAAIAAALESLSDAQGSAWKRRTACVVRLRVSKSEPPTFRTV